MTLLTADLFYELFTVAFIFNGNGSWCWWKILVFVGDGYLVDDRKKVFMKIITLLMKRKEVYNSISDWVNWWILFNITMAEWISGLFHLCVYKESWFKDLGKDGGAFSVRKSIKKYLSLPEFTLFYKIYSKNILYQNKTWRQKSQKSHQFSILPLPLMP